MVAFMILWEDTKVKFAELPKREMGVIISLVLQKGGL
jgi:hypothetical protein